MIELARQIAPNVALICAAVGAVVYSAVTLPRVRRGMMLPNGATSRTARTWYGAALLAAVATAATALFGAAIGLLVTPIVTLVAAWVRWSF